jgi:hypothetical protein
MLQCGFVRSNLALAMSSDSLLDAAALRVFARRRIGNVKVR